MPSEKKRRGRGKNITSALELLDREPYRTIIEIIYLFGEAEPRQIICVSNNENEKALILRDKEMTQLEKLRHLHHIDRYGNKNEVKWLSRPDNPSLYPLNSDNLKKFLNTLIKCGIIERKGRGKYQIAWAFKKEFVRESNKNVINRYSGSAITDKAREYGITLYGLEHFKGQLKKADVLKSDFNEFSPDELEYLNEDEGKLKGENYLNNIEDKLLKIFDKLYEVSADVKTAHKYLVTVFLFKQLKQQSKSIRNFFIKHNWEERAKFFMTGRVKIMFLLGGSPQSPKCLIPEEVEIAKDYLNLNEEERNIVKKLVSECRREYNKVNVPFSLFYSDEKISPSPLTIEGALKESRIKAIMNDNTLSSEKQEQLLDKVYKEQYPDVIDELEAYEEESKKRSQEFEQEIEEKLNELGINGDEVVYGDIPEVLEILGKHVEKLQEKTKKKEENG